MLTLVIGNQNYSSWSLRAWLALRKSGIAFTTHRIALDQPDTTNRIAKVSLAGKVPVLLDGTLTVWDSLAICEYIAEGAPRLLPQDRVRRARMRSVCAEMHAGFSALRRGMPMNCRASGRRVAINEDMDRDLLRVNHLWEGLRHEHYKEGPWLFGAFSLADAMYAPVVSRFITYGVQPVGRAGDYIQHVHADADMVEWYAAALAETEIIAADEAGDESGASRAGAAAHDQPGAR